MIGSCIIKIACIPLALRTARRLIDRVESALEKLFLNAEDWMASRDILRLENAFGRGFDKKRRLGAGHRQAVTKKTAR